MGLVGILHLKTVGFMFQTFIEVMHWEKLVKSMLNDKFFYHHSIINCYIINFILIWDSNTPLTKKLQVES